MLTPSYGSIKVFIDPSGTNRYYKEFEMNCQNATYDVMCGECPTTRR
jgi:hypothetical protein